MLDADGMCGVCGRILHRKGLVIMDSIAEYMQFINSKAQWKHELGFRVDRLPEFLFPFQRFLVEWALNKGRAAIFADCGLGKTAMQLSWANEVIRKENKPVLLLTPLAVGAQTVAEAEKFGIDAKRTRDGVFDGSKVIWVTNYEQLHKYDPNGFSGVVCDESSSIKDFKSERKKTVVEFLRTIKYRLLCTATAAPNDFFELGTSSEALGLLGFRDMITTFFKMETSKDIHGWGRTKYRFRGHAESPFWSWVCSWARSMRMPSDLGFCDEGFILPQLIESEFVVETEKKRDGMLFAMPGKTLQDERKERRNSISERVEKAASIVSNHDGVSVCWCELNDEADMLESVIPNSVQVSGSMSDDEKEYRLTAFSSGDIPCLITKPKIGAWGLNWQHCSNIVTFPSHSYEQYYQAIRRCFRFGQKRAVNVSIIVNEGEVGMLENLRRKGSQSDRMFSEIVAHMKDAMHLTTTDAFLEKEVIPSWL